MDWWFAPTASWAALSAGQTLSPARFGNSSVFYAPTVAATYSLAPARFDNSPAFYAPTVAATYSLTPARLDNGVAVYPPQVDQLPLVLAPLFLASGSKFFVLRVRRGVAPPEFHPQGQPNSSAWAAHDVAISPAWDERGIAVSSAWSARGITASPAWVERQPTPSPTYTKSY